MKSAGYSLYNEKIKKIILEIKETIWKVNYKGKKTIKNTRGFVLYFLMKEYTSVPYIGGISVRYK